MSYDETHAARLKDIKVLGNRINSIVNANNAGAHNSLYRGKNLGGTITDKQFAAIRNGSFAGLYLGDYWATTINDVSVAFTILGFDLFLFYISNIAGGNVNRHHAVLIPLYYWQTHPWTFPINDTATCEGHIKNSKLYTEHFPAILADIEGFVGAEHIIPMQDDVADSIDANGNVNHRIASIEKLFLLSMFNLTGIMNNPDHTGWLKAGRVFFPSFAMTSPHFNDLTMTFLSENDNATQWRVLSNHGNYTWIFSANTPTNIHPFFMLG